MKSRCVDHDEDVVVRGYGGSGLDCSTDDHLDDYIEQALLFRAHQVMNGTARGERKRGKGQSITKDATCMTEYHVRPRKHSCAVHKAQRVLLEQP